MTSSGIQPSIGAIHTGCLTCGSHPETASMDWYPHPGFGSLDLTCDGEQPDWWREFCCWPTPWVCWGSWESGTIKAGARKGQPWHDWIGGEDRISLVEELTLGDIEECCATDPDHDWRLTTYGPMYGAVWQRHGDKLWHPIERMDGFA